MGNKDERPPKVLEVLENQKQLKDRKEHGIDDKIDKVVSNSSYTANLSSALQNYTYTTEDIDTFFASDNGQEEEHELEQSICRPLIGRQNNKPYFYYCKEYPKVENINFKNIKDHIMLKDSERHKSKLLELLGEEKVKEKQISRLKNRRHKINLLLSFKTIFHNYFI
jgi:hypothetical protein